MSTSTLPVRSAFEDGLYRKISVRLLPFLTLCYMFAFLDRINVGFAKLQMQSSLGMSDAVYGMGAGIFFIGYVLFEIPSNLLLPRIGARRTLSRIMVLWGLVSASMLFVHDATSFYALRFLLGVFEAGFAPGMILYLTYWYSPKHMGRTMAIVMAAGPIGGLVGGPLSSWAMTALAGSHGLQGWQWMFIVEGLPCVLLGLAAWCYLPDRPEHASWLNTEDKQYLQSTLDAHGTAHGTVEGLLSAARDMRVIGIAFCNFCVICGIYTVSFWLPSLLKAAGVVSTMAIGLWTAVPYLASIVAMYAISASSDRLRERRVHYAVPCVVGGVALVVATLYAHNLAVTLSAMTIATAAMWSAYTVLWAVPGDYLRGNRAPGGIGFINVVGVLGGFFSPVIMGKVKTLTGSLQGGMYFMIGLLFLGAVVMLINRFSHSPENTREIEPHAQGAHRR